MENDKSTMTDEEMVKDYPRLKLEYTRLHEDYRRLQTKQLNIGVVSNCNYSYDEFQLRLNECYTRHDYIEFKKWCDKNIK